MLMSAAEIRAELHRLIDQLDERFLKAVFMMVSVYQKPEKDPLEDLMVPGLPGTEEEIETSIEKAEEQIASEEYYTIDEVREKATQWFNTK